MSPLSHHEILELIEPFTRSGRHVDLAGSDRLQRRLSFQPVQHQIAGERGAFVLEFLQLEKLATGTCRLTRVLRLPSGLQASLTAMGMDTGALLAAFDRVAPARHFWAEATYEIARSYDFATSRTGTAGQNPPVLLLTRGVALLDGLRLTLNLSAVRGVPAEILLENPSGSPRLELPEDLLAVLGWDWVGLVRTTEGYKSKIRLRGDSARRSDGAAAALQQAARHLVATLAEPPGRFHGRWARARWGVVFRRSIPVLTLAALISAIACLPHFVVAGNPGLWLLLFHIPTALIALSFCLQEQAQYEIPPLPRRLLATSWHR